MFKQAGHPLKPWEEFQDDLDAKALACEPRLSTEPGVYADLWLMGVHADYRGRKLAHLLVTAGLKARFAGR